MSLSEFFAIVAVGAGVVALFLALVIHVQDISSSTFLTAASFVLTGTGFIFIVGLGVSKLLGIV